MSTWRFPRRLVHVFGSFNAIASAIGTVNTAYLPSGSAFLSSSPSTTPDQQAGGVWTRSVGSTVNTQADTNFSALFTVTPPNGPRFPVPLNIPCRASVKQSFAGFEAGHDIAILNTGNSDVNWHFGVLAGYVGVKAETPQSVPTDSLQSGNFEPPSAGLYAAFHKGNFSADVQARLYNERLGDLSGEHYVAVKREPTSFFLRLHSSLPPQSLHQWMSLPDSRRPTPSGAGSSFSGDAHSGTTTVFKQPPGVIKSFLLYESQREIAIDRLVVATSSRSR